MYRLLVQSGKNKGRRLLVRQATASVGSAKSCTIRLRETECPVPQACRLEKCTDGVAVVALVPEACPVAVDGRMVAGGGEAGTGEGTVLRHGGVLSVAGVELQYQDIIPPNAPRLKPSGGVAQFLSGVALLLIVATELALLAFTANWPHYIIEENVEKLDIAYAERMRQLNGETEGEEGKEKKAEASSILVMPGSSLTEPKAKPETEDGGSAEAATGSGDASPAAADTVVAAPPELPPDLPEALREALEGADFTPAELGDIAEGLPEVAVFDPVKENIESLLTEAKAAAQFSDYPRAFMLLNQIHQMAPGNLPAHMYHARLLESRGDLEAAFRRWHQLLGLVGKDDPERAEIMQAGRRLQQRLRMQRDVSGHAGVDPDSLPRLVRIEDPTMQKMPSDSEIAEMRILRGKLEFAENGPDRNAPLRLYITFYDQEPGGRIVPTRALVSPSPLMLAASGANSSGAIPFEATYIVPAVHREGTQELMPHTSIYHGFTLHLFSGDTLQDAYAKPARLLELPIHVAAPGGAI